MKVFLPGKKIFELLLRYLLAAAMAAYGFVKITGQQFQLPAQVLDYPLKNLDGVTLTWAFLGHSPWFSVLLGLFELVPALLLLFARTKLWGGLLLFPVLLSVFLVNLAYGFMIHMQVLTGVLLMMNVALLALHRLVLTKAVHVVHNG